MADIAEYTPTYDEAEQAAEQFDRKDEIEVFQHDFDGGFCTPTEHSNDTCICGADAHYVWIKP